MREVTQADLDCIQTQLGALRAMFMQLHIAAHAESQRLLKRHLGLRMEPLFLPFITPLARV